ASAIPSRPRAAPPTPALRGVNDATCSRGTIAAVDAEELFDEVVESQLGEPDVSESQMFGAPGLKTGGKFFVTLFRGELAVKLPKERVDELVASGDGSPFEPME